MPDRPDIYLDNPDALSSVLTQLRLAAEIYVDGNFCGNWAVDNSGIRQMPFHLIRNGHAWLHMDNQTPMPLPTGSLVIFPQDHRHIVSSSEQAPDPTIINAGFAPDAQPITTMVCGFFEFASRAAWPLLDSLPAVIKIDLQDAQTPQALKALFDILVNELNEEAPGFYTAINQISLLLFIHIIREQIRSNTINKGLIAAIFDKNIGKALNVIHNQPEKNWTLASLADQAAMSRSSFAQRFHELTGTPAISYLGAWRMQIATKLLETSTYSIQEIAERSGYESEAAFRKAFKKITRVTPGEIRKKSNKN